MNEQEVWDKFAAKNPDVARGETPLSPTGLRKLVSLVYRLAHDHGFKNGKAWQQMHAAEESRRLDPFSIFRR
jgi:hypothetical protein